jgi:hypothetical protein
MLCDGCSNVWLCLVLTGWDCEEREHQDSRVLGNL